MPIISAILCFVFTCDPVMEQAASWQNKMPEIMRTAPMDGRQMIVLVSIEHGN